MERNRTNAQIEAEVDVIMKELHFLSEEALLEGFRQSLILNRYLQRQLLETANLARVVYIGPKGEVVNPKH
jgi:hypothetical protein